MNQLNLFSRCTNVINHELKLQSKFDHNFKGILIYSHTIVKIIEILNDAVK